MIIGMIHDGLIDGEDTYKISQAIASRQRTLDEEFFKNKPQSLSLEIHPDAVIPTVTVDEDSEHHVSEHMD